MFRGIPSAYVTFYKHTHITNKIQTYVYFICNIM